MLIGDPQQGSVDWLALDNGEYRKLERGAMIELGPVELHDQLQWPEESSV